MRYSDFSFCNHLSHLIINYVILFLIIDKVTFDCPFECFIVLFGTIKVYSALNSCLIVTNTRYIVFHTIWNQFPSSFEIRVHCTMKTYGQKWSSRDQLFSGPWTRTWNETKCFQFRIGDWFMEKINSCEKFCKLRR